MKQLLILMLLPVLLLPVAAAQEPNTTTVKKFTFTWLLQDDSLTCTLTAPVKGWVACGFKPTKKMKNANIIIGNSVDGRATVVDHFGTGSVQHKADVEIGGTRDITNATCVEHNDSTTLSFTIPLSPDDKKDVALVKGETIKVIFAASKSDKLTARHSFRTSAQIKL